MTAYLMTMNPASLSTDDPETLTFLDEQARRFREGESLEASWWSTRTKSHEAGACVYLLRQGVEPRGIIASGTLPTGEVEPGESFRGDGSEIDYVWIEWDAVLDPEQALPLAELKALAPATYWSPMASGSRIKPADEAAVADAWNDHLTSLRGQTGGAGPGGGGGGGGGGEIEPSYAVALRKVRKHQAKFRRLLLEHYPPECTYCGLDVLEVIEAAHLIPDSKGGAASTENGRLLCANHHRAFDAGLLRWTGGEFEQVEGAATVLPVPPP